MCDTEQKSAIWKIISFAFNRNCFFWSSSFRPNSKAGPWSIIIVRFDKMRPSMVSIDRFDESSFCSVLFDPLIIDNFCIINIYFSSSKWQYNNNVIFGRRYSSRWLIGGQRYILVCVTWCRSL